jgi:hypothetical protein
MKKIAKLEYFREVVTQVRGVCVWVRRHSVPLAVFKELSPQVLQMAKHALGLQWLCLERFVDRETHNALESMFTHPQFTSWEKKQPKAARNKIALAKKIVFDGKVRSKSKLLVKLLAPIMKVLQLFDRGVPVIGFVHFAVADLRERADKLMSDHQLLPR